MKRVARIKPFKFRTPRTTFRANFPPKPQIAPAEEQELLTGSVRGLKASAPEERLANALDKKGFQYLFRYSVGAPRGLPGWKELDFLVQARGLLYAVEVDTAFTHRTKANSDVLHDAIVLNDKELQTMGQLWPTVTHVDGESDLVDAKNSDTFVAAHFGSVATPGA